MRFVQYEDGQSRYCKMNLDEEQLKILREFREKVGPKIPEWMNSDIELSRWLIARNFCLDKAEDMLLKSLDWRKKWNIDSILDWDAPEILKKYYAAGFSGYAKNGSPVLIVPYGNADTRGMLHCCCKRDFINCTIQYLERTMAKIREISSETEDPVTDAIFIFDMDNFSFREFTWKPSLDVILLLLQMYEANYPEILKYAFVVNAPKIFSAAFAIMKPFINENTIRKVKIYGTKDWQEYVLNEICPDQLPVHWGGTMTDPDGNPKCPSKIGCGGKIPKSYYVMSNDPNVDANFKTVVLPKSGKKVFDSKVLKPNTELRWKFYSEDYDVGFQVSLDTSSGDQEIIVPYQRVYSHMVPEKGSIVCSTPGTYNIIFDNSYSYLRSKKIYYSIELVEPP